MGVGRHHCAVYSALSIMTVSASAPGKIILFGEHAVVYGQPALAIPVNGLLATASIAPAAPGNGLIIDAVDLNIQLGLAEAADEALAMTARMVLDRLALPQPDAIIQIQSTIPVASGLGSGAAVSAALARALSAYLDQSLSDSELSTLVYQIEKMHHGTPSGIDNTVICYNKAVYFIRDRALELLKVGAPFHILIGDTGKPSPTRITVAAVRSAWEHDPETFDSYFKAIGDIANKARAAIETGELKQLGPLMNDNQAILENIGVSSPELEALITDARIAGAAGAKLSGGGGGGNMIALVQPDDIAAVSAALSGAGAVRVVHTVVQ
jgi:mevalonate kinase